MAQGFLVVLDHRLVITVVPQTEWRLSAGIPNGPIAPEALLEHVEQHRHVAVHVVVDPHFGLAGVQPMEPASRPSSEPDQAFGEAGITDNDIPF